VSLELFDPIVRATFRKKRKKKKKKDKKSIFLD